MSGINLKVGKDISEFPPIMNERPEGMKFSAYKMIQKKQTKALKRRLRSGFKIK